MFRNGIASDDRYLYLACAEVDQNAQPLLTGWLPQLTKRPQDALGFTLLLLAETLCPVRSYVLRADLSVKPLRFGDHVALAGKCFANGLAVDKNGNVYVASGSGIHRVPSEAWTAPSKDPIKLWHRTDPPVPNGIKATDKKLFFTRLGQPPLFSSMVTAMAPDDKPMVIDESLCRQNGVLYDDFDVADGGSFVVAVVSDMTNMLGAFAGALVFFSADGFRWARGAGLVRDFAVPGAQYFGVAFCARCGSEVPRVSAERNVVNVPAGSLDTEPGVEPLAHIFVGSKAPWDLILGDIPQFAEMPTRK